MTTRQQAIKPPDAAPGNEVAGNQRLGDKRDVAALAGMRSIRWVELQMVAGMPHLKLGPRRVRFDLEEVREWLRENYLVQRRKTGKSDRLKADQNHQITANA